MRELSLSDFFKAQGSLVAIPIAFKGLMTKVSTSFLLVSIARFGRTVILEAHDMESDSSVLSLFSITRSIKLLSFQANLIGLLTYTSMRDLGVNLNLMLRLAELFTCLISDREEITPEEGTT